MKENIGNTILLIQKKKNIKIKDICQDYFSKSTYFRVVNGEIDTSIVNFKYIIDSLYVSFDEFFFLCNANNEKDNPITNEQEVMIKIKELYVAKNISELQFLKKTLENQADANVYIHLIWLIELLIDKLTKKTINIKQNKLANYLIKIETWTNYELTLFNNCMFSFSIDIVNLLTMSIVSKLKNGEIFHKNNSEVFVLLVNAIVTNIENENYNHAYLVFKELNTIKLDEDLLFERNILLFWSGVFKLPINKEIAITKMDESLNIFQTLGAKKNYLMHKELKQYLIIKLENFSIQ